MIEDITPDDITEAIAEGMAEEIKNTPVAIAKNMALELSQLWDSYMNAKQMVQSFDEAKGNLASYCEKNGIIDIEVGNHRFTVVKSIPSSVEHIQAFDEVSFRKDNPEEWASYLKDTAKEHKGRAAYLRETKVNG